MENLTIREQLRRNALATRQAAIMPSGCKACTREGITIFPLRIAAVPKHTDVPEWHVTPALTGGEYKYALRTLREGYLYILLDGAFWQSYEVTAEGAMRQFNAYERPETDHPAPLEERCRTKGHDIISGFISIDPRFSQAEIAFSSDTWSKTVLRQYQNKRPAGRFTRVDLNAFKAVPGQHERGLSLDYTLSSLTGRVVEFRTELFPQPGIGLLPYMKPVQGGMHGFFPRQHPVKLAGMRERVTSIIHQSGSAGAIILDDAVGVIQELNYGRLQLIKDCHDYTSRTEVRHQYITSQAISRTMEVVKKAIQENSQPEYGRPASGYPFAMQQITSAEDVAKRDSAYQLAQLNACYNESARATFEQTYKDCVKGSQEIVASVDSDLAVCYLNPAWLTVMDNDYAPQDVHDWFLHMKTMAVCLQGGPVSEHSDKVWQRWMKHADSPAYIGILAYNHTQASAVFNGSVTYSGLEQVKAMQVQTPVTASILAGSAGYSYLKTAGASDEFTNYLKQDAVQTLVTARIMALNASYSRLVNKLDDASRNGYSRMLQGSAYSMTGEAPVLFELKTSIRRFQRLVQLNQRSWSSLAFGGEGPAKFAAATGGLMNISDPRILDMPATIRITSMYPGAQAALDALPERTSLPEKMSAIPELRVSSLSLRDDVGARMNVTPESLLTDRNRRFLSGNSIGLILSAVMLGLQISDWQQNSDNLAQAVVNHTDASMTLAINRLMVLSAASEIGGFSHMLMTRMSWKALEKTGFVHPLIKAGGVIAGAAAVIDGVRMYVQVYDGIRAGDYLSSSLYFIGGTATLAGGTLGIVSSWNGLFALSGAAGLAALLILVGAGIAYTAAQYRSTPLEIWLRCTCFGINRHGSDVIWHENVPAELPKMLDSWYAVMSGMVAEVALSAPTIIYGEYYREVKMKLVLPGYQPGVSALTYCLTAGGSELVAGSESGNPTFASRCVNPDIRSITSDDRIILISACVRETQCSPAVLTAQFWPDAADKEYRAGLTVKGEC